MPEKLYTKKEVAQLLGVSEITIHRLTTMGRKMGFYRIGSKVFISQGHIDAYLKTTEQKAASQSDAALRARLEQGTKTEETVN